MRTFYHALIPKQSATPAPTSAPNPTLVRAYVASLRSHNTALELWLWQVRARCAEALPTDVETQTLIDLVAEEMLSARRLIRELEVGMGMLGRVVVVGRRGTSSSFSC
ncbi:hypothetical protein LTR28_005834 [Elasticomyces elasticus]|nr:hypothetical protein LTR28_005834 [Elasticomyces elasticus]